MGYQRASWHSGLTYAQTCSKCNTKVIYMDDKLDFRPWYADGFVYCPTCQTPLRHNETYAINKPTETVVVDMTGAASDKPAGLAAFCSNCGRAFQPQDHFCPNCGHKR